MPNYTVSHVIAFIYCRLRLTLLDLLQEQLDECVIDPQSMKCYVINPVIELSY